MIVDREEEMGLFKNLIDGNFSYRIMNICEKGGKGKSYLVRAFQQYCKEIRSPCSLIEFTVDHAMSPIDCMREIVDFLGEHYFVEFIKQEMDFHHQQPFIQIGGGESEGGASITGNLQDAEIDRVAGRDNISISNISIVNQDVSQNRLLYFERVLTRIFKKELENLCKTEKVVIIFDGVEHVPSSTANWLWKHLLLALRERSSYNLLIILSGRPEGSRPTFTPIHEWKHILYEIKAFGDFKREHVLEYFHRKLDLPIEESDIDAYYRVCKNNPLIMGQIGDILFSETWK